MRCFYAKSAGSRAVYEEVFSIAFPATARWDLHESTQFAAGKHGGR
jgi:hypothetical protein